MIVPITGRVVLLCLGCAVALPHGGLRSYFSHRLTDLNTASTPVKKTKSELSFKQVLDHFDRTNDETFSQRYFVNSTFFDGSGPVFLCVGGEGPALDASVLVSSVHCNDMVELAPKARALMFALEHRYYGESMPSKDSSLTLPEYFRYLSTEQAVADIATFYEMASTSYNLTSSNRWVTWGGSYPGLLAGFARLKLPHLIFAAVSSSSPWKAQVDMQVYNDLVGRALTLESIGGSEECGQIVVDGHAAIKAILDNGTDVQSLASTFDFCDASSLEDKDVQKQWAGYGVISIPAQANDPTAPGPAGNIEQICSALLDDDSDDPVAKLAKVSKLQNPSCVMPYLVSDYYKMLGRIGESSSLSWPWQTCTEYGYYQTCEADSDCPYAKGYVTLKDELSMCHSLFNIKHSKVDAFVNFTNALYGADEPQTSRVFFANGDVDPWSGLGVLKSPDNNVSQIVLLVSGSSHHAWTHPEDTITQPAVSAAKKIIQDQVMTWLAETSLDDASTAASPLTKSKF